MRIVLVDDDSGIRDALTTGFKLFWEDSTIIAARDGEEGLQAFSDENPDVVLLDVAMPGKNGFEVLRAIRLVSDVPVLLLTGRDEEIDQVRGLELGADDYIAKPFSHLALLARIRAVLRRAALPPSAAALPTFVVGDLTIHHQSHQVTVAGQPVRLTPLEYKLLDQLARHPGRLLSHQTLLDRVWGEDYGATTDHLKVFICRLRAKLQGPPGAASIETERGLGYRFVQSPEMPFIARANERMPVYRAPREASVGERGPLIAVA